MVNSRITRDLQRNIDKSSHFRFRLSSMKRNTKNASRRRRRPVQVRAKVTVDAMLDAAVRLLKRNGISSVTTNRVAETAGVSIGSVYQYFPNKHALFVALHTRHIEQVNDVIRRRIMESGESSLEQL